MRKLVLMHLLREISQKRNLKRKIFVALAAGVAVLIVTTGFVVWLGIQSINYVATHLPQSVSVPQSVASLQQSAMNQPLLKTGCIDRAQSYLNPRLWLERPVALNIKDLKEACFQNHHNPSSQEKESVI